MSSIVLRAVPALLAIVAAAGCNDQSMSPDPGQSGTENLAVEAKVQGSPGDRAAIQQIVNTFDEAWTAGDAVTYVANYAHVSEWVGPDGTILTDPVAITNLYTAILTFGLSNTTRESTIRNLTFLTGTIAVVNIEARVTGFESLPPGLVPWQPGVLRALEKNILLKRDGEWRIVQHQQLLAAPGT
jgi:uncharacterized protein (TIGR02246 family)